MEQIGIYCIENLINHKKYVGQSTDLYNRLVGHKSKLKTNKHYNERMQLEANEYGIENFSFYVIERCATNELDGKERYYIALYQCDNNEHGYNTEPGGFHTKKTMSELTKKKISQTLQGREFSEEHRAKIGAKNKGRGMSEETRQKIKDHHADMSGQKNPRANVPIYCPELDESFWGPKAAQDKYGFSRAHISSCIHGKLKHTGKHPITGEPLTWVKIESKDC